MKQRRNWVVNAPTHITAIIPNNLSSPRCVARPAPCNRRSRRCIRRRISSVMKNWTTSRAICVAMFIGRKESTGLLFSLNGFTRRGIAHKARRGPREIAATAARVMLSLTPNRPNFAHYLATPCFAAAELAESAEARSHESITAFRGSTLSHIVFLSHIYSITSVYKIIHYFCGFHFA